MEPLLSFFGSSLVVLEFLSGSKLPYVYAFYHQFLIIPFLDQLSSVALRLKL